jgi:hypothetical protein
LASKQIGKTHTKVRKPNQVAWLAMDNYDLNALHLFIFQIKSFFRIWKLNKYHTTPIERNGHEK